jgi:DNA invertase Pin-like site-specific DNA recombinase
VFALEDAQLDRPVCTLLERFERRGVALVSVAESLDTGSAAGRLVLNIMTAVSQWEREAIGERTRDAMSHKRTNGERVGNIQFIGCAPMGSTSSQTPTSRQCWMRSALCARAVRPCAESPLP